MEKPQKTSRLERLKPLLRPWPVYLLAIAVVGGTVYMVRNRAEGQADPVLPPAVKLEQNIEIQFGEVIMQGRQKGVQRWVITAPKVSLSRDGRYTTFDPDPTGKFYNLKDWQATEEKPSEKNRELNWKAKRAEFDSFTEDLSIEGSAVLTTDAGDVIKTERVEYKSRAKQVLMPKPVDIDMKDGTEITANELSANTDAEVLELKGKVDFTTNVNPEAKL